MISAIILAAGRSRRMGAQKLLLPFGGRTVIGHVAGQVLRSPVDRTFVVVRRDGARIAEALAGLRLEIVTHTDPGGEMLGSVRCGLRAIPPDSEAVLVTLGDQPTLTADLVARMIAAFRAEGRGILVPACRGKPGHPILFSMRYREEVLTRYDDVGLCGLRRAHPEDVLELAVTSPSVLTDMDYPEDYRQALAEFRP
jgi:molybdenum cofactor cytidylyltransferase